MASILAFAAPLAAEERPVVVELYTSQGCSSCPPADALLQELAAREDVIALSLHVDYWDYIGWKDRFADPAHAERQRAYAHAGGRRMVYTPQMIVEGQESIVGIKRMKLNDLIRAHQNAVSDTRLEIERGDGGLVRLSVAPADQPLANAADLYLVRFTPSRRVEITRGENAGRTMDYANVVEEWVTIGQWDGQGPGEFRFDVNGDLPAVVLVQSIGTGRIHAAGRLP
jgi:hypothetical protein